MMNLRETYNYSDLSIIPSVLSDINSRSECNPKYGAMLPLFTAPMDSVVNVHNLDYWSTNGITPIIPRNIPYDTRLNYLCTSNNWIALSLNEFETLFCKDNKEIQSNILPKEHVFRVCVDIANGHQKRLLCMIVLAKTRAKKYGYNLEVMAGNIANPDVYKKYCEAGADYVRCGIGGGSGCLTTSNVGVHYGLASLIIECKEIKDTLHNDDTITPTKIIADGGITGFKDAIIALACGADYVMIGGIFASFLESAASILNCQYLENGDIVINSKCITKEWLQDEDNKRQFIKEYCLIKDFHGMSTKEAQLAINPNTTALKTSEGKSLQQKVEYTMEQWSTNFEDYLKSAMSYANCYNLYEFKNNVRLNIMSRGTKERINK